MLKKKPNMIVAGLVVAALAPLAALAQDPQNPPPQQQQPQYPPPQEQQYPAAQPQYPPQQQPYPAQQQPGYPPPQQPGYPPQQQYPVPPPIPPDQIDGLVQRIALYPDPLLAQVLTAATFSNEIPDAAGWANQHRYLTGDQLAHAISEDRLPWDPSVLALLPFPQTLDMMARDMGWTQALGNAVLGQRPEVMDAVQRMRERARQYGYLQSNAYDRVVGGPGEIQIVPVDTGYLYVPTYNPYVVFAPPRPGFFVGGAISFGPRIFLGASFAPFGWGGIGVGWGGFAFGWRSHDILINNHPWGRTFVNRGYYAHPYAVPYRRPEGPRVERHEFREHERDRR
jgi:hypothetical protein